MSDPRDRRPIASRNTAFARRITGFLVRRNLTPNAISMLSMLAAGVAGLAFALAGGHWGGLLLAALACQMRLLCNLFDGLVAVEGGKGGPDGPFWNEAPDRISDLLIFAGLGWAVGRPDLGYLVGALAVLTAYIRELGRANGAGNDFSGPLAKPQRMALVTLAAVAQAAALLADLTAPLLLWTLWGLLVGTAVTVLRRSWRQIRHLRGQG
ncbi:CDP-alcohol phosphatidyltransferase family protein [Falsigemmobacter faecalis]|uniref:CDP-alcohol phosphatidyltransferase family protein n=1 Tax=Falsigemmobacter faecalis TaxID=2488730 RepID=A0A3P3D5X8_9RHOB|nr:CDP-alcohol phosphatidyltransferase family protein [Falsigemmobacter faecalis]RRH69765.1 CDP-alcohol phosphatidyltransferase family protein [Falsigemmobacter faecalis]